MKINVPDNEIIAVIRLYGKVEVVDGDIIFWRYSGASFVGSPSWLFTTLLKWMEDAVKDIEGENNHAK